MDFDLFTGRNELKCNGMRWERLSIHTIPKRPYTFFPPLNKQASKHICAIYLSCPVYMI